MTTIRERLKGRMSKAMAILLAFWLLFATGLFFPKGSAFHPLWIIPFIGFIGYILYILLFKKCPRCSTRIGYPMSISRPNFCPGCGVSLDDPV